MLTWVVLLEMEVRKRDLFLLVQFLKQKKKSHPDVFWLRERIQAMIVSFFSKCWSIMIRYISLLLYPEGLCHGIANFLVVEQYWSPLLKKNVFEIFSIFPAIGWTSCRDIKAPYISMICILYYIPIHAYNNLYSIKQKFRENATMTHTSLLNTNGQRNDASLTKPQGVFTLRQCLTVSNIETWSRCVVFLSILKVFFCISIRLLSNQLEFLQ